MTGIKKSGRSRTAEGAGPYSGQVQNPSGTPPGTVYCVIMAGGKGERFWPMSTDRVPKPFLTLTGDKTLIQLTAERALRIVPEERLLVVLGKAHLKAARQQLAFLPENNFLVEPAGRDTAACIGLAAVHISLREPEAAMVVLPADQYIPDVDDFVATLNDAVKLASAGNHLVTLGIAPSRPETGYGYILAGRACGHLTTGDGFVVERFVEKPGHKQALEYIADGRYYWNAGIFIWHVNAIIEGFRAHMPGLYEGLTMLKKYLQEGRTRAADTLFKGFERKSIDYGIMEKAANVLMVSARFRWDDVGTWASLERVLDLDDNGNCILGNAFCIDTADTILFSEPGYSIGTIGVSDLIIVASKKGLLVCDKKRVQEVREIARRLRKNKP